MSKADDIAAHINAMLDRRLSRNRVRTKRTLHKPRVRWGRRMRSTTVYLDADVLSKLRILSQRKRLPFAALVREGIDMMLAVKTGSETATPDTEGK